MYGEVKPRIAYNNLLDTAIDLTATNVDTDSSVNNLYHPYMEHAMNCTESNTTVSGRWGQPKSFTCIAVAYHNADDAVLTLKGISGNALYVKSITLESNDATYYFGETIENVYSFTLSVSGGEAIRIGYIYLGVCVEIPSFARGSTYPLSLNGEMNRTRGGQVSGLMARTIQGYQVSFPRFNNEDMNTLLEYIDTVQNVKPHMVDLFPSDHSYLPAFYGVLSINNAEIKKRIESGFYYELELKWEESR